MTRDDYDYQLFRADWLKCLVQSYRQEHNWDDDEDHSATNEMLSECMNIHAKLVADLGEPPAVEVCMSEPDPSIPF